MLRLDYGLMVTLYGYIKTAGPLYSNTVIGRLAVDGWAVTFGTANGRDRSPPRPFLVVSTVTAHPSVASLPITVLLYNGPMMCGFNVPIKGLK